MSDGNAQLPKVYSFHHYLSLSIGYALGLGWVIIPARMLIKGGPIGVFLAIIFSAILFYFIAKCYAELVCAKPAAGGETVIAERSFGKGVGFSVFWFLCLGYIAYGPFYASFSGVIFESLIPNLQSDTLFTIEGHGQRLSYILPGLVLASLVVLTNFKSTKAAANLQSISLLILIICVSIAVITGFIKGNLSNLQPYFEGSGTALDITSVVIIVMSMICWYLFGFSTIAQTAEEAGPDMKPGDLGKAIVLSLGLATLFYAAVHLYVPYTMPWRASTELGMPTADVLNATYGYAWAHKLVLIGGFMGIITTLNACMICATRLMLAATRAGYMPKWFGVIDKKSETLKNAVKFVGFFMIIGPFLSLGWTSSNMGPISFVLASIITCFAALKMRKSHPDMARPYKIKNTLTIYCGIFVSLTLFGSMLVPGSYEYIVWPERHIFIAIWAALGFLFYKWQISIHK